MAASLIIEVESGTYQARRSHPHNGYFAGDFSNQPFCPMKPLTGLITYPADSNS